MSYRDILYSNYSASFEGAKAFLPQQQFAQYDAIYGVPSLGHDASVLDIGCGKGEWLGWMQQRGYQRLIGVDGSASDTAIAREHWQGIDIVQHEAVQYLADHGDQFDLIHAKDVIEHMTKDEIVAFVQAAHAALRSGGQLWLHTFNAQSPLAATTRYGDFTHEMGLTPTSIAQCLRACGFRAVQVRGVHYCSRSFGGRMRALLAKPIYACARFMLKLRHGQGSATAGVDAMSPLPDMVAIATKVA
jgi:cyclopropane fatty-acyl-phospholipid synthase-like methyltransferase